jgi:hypothetical protein
LAIERTRNAFGALGVDSSEIEFGHIDDYVRRHQGEFDAVLSFGLIEHFANFDEILLAHFHCARVGGRIFVTAPNLSGLQLAWARRISPETFSLNRTVTTVWHRPISAPEVASAFRRLGATEIAVRHTGGPRLWAYPDDAPSHSLFKFRAALALRKGVNGAGEALNRLAPPVARRVAGVSLSPEFAVAGTKVE